MRAVSLRRLASGRGVVTPKQAKQIRRWIDADWESHDVDRDAVKLIQRLLGTLWLIGPSYD